MTTATLTLADFLSRRLDEAERYAAAGVDYLQHQGATWTEAVDYLCRPGVGLLLGAHLQPLDPARVLADVAAKRAIVERSLMADRDAARLAPGERGAAAMYNGCAELMRHVLRLLAQPFRDHPDFDPAWLV